MASLMAMSMCELLGTAVFFSTIWGVGEGYAIALGLFVAILIFGPISGGHFNSTVTMLKLIGGEIGGSQAGAYIMSQLIGGAIAILISKNLLGKQ